MMKSAPAELTPEEIAEIERHKYFLSEKAGHDVGWEYAEEDWRNNVAGQTFRQDAGSESGGLGGLFRRMLSKSKAR